MNLSEAERVFRHTGWSDLLDSGAGTPFAVLVDGEPVLATVVEAIDKEDADNDRDLAVTVEVNGQFFQKTGWSQIGSHCYGEYEPSWNELREVRPRQQLVTLYEAI